MHLSSPLYLPTQFCTRCERTFIHLFHAIVHTSGKSNTVEPTYNDIGLCDISSIASDILWYQLIPYLIYLIP
jgi:hypothetical protein